MKLLSIIITIQVLQIGMVFWYDRCINLEMKKMKEQIEKLKQLIKYIG